MPRPPEGLFNQINYIIKFWMDPCDAPLTVYVETALPALLRAIISYYAFDLINVVTGFARPSAAIGRQRRQKKGRKGSKRGRRWGPKWLRAAAGFDAGEWAGKKLAHAVPGLQDRYVTNRIAHLWIIFGVLERFMYWWMVLSIIFDFWLEWTSSLYATEYCQELDRAVLLATGENQLISDISTGNPLLILQVQKQRGEIAVVPGGATMGAGHYSIMVETTVSPGGAGNSIVLAIYRSENWPGGAPLASVTAIGGGGAPIPMALSAEFDGPGQVTVVVYTQQLLGTASDSLLSIYQN